MMHLFFQRHIWMIQAAIACFLATVISMGICSFPPLASAKTLSFHQIQKQSLLLYEQLHSQKHSQAEIDAALQKQFGLQPVGDKREAAPLTSTNSDITLSTPSIDYDGRHRVTFVYADFTWDCTTGASCHGDPMDYSDDFGIWFSRNIPLASTDLTVTEVVGPPQFYENPTDFNQAGADYAQNANYWVSGDLEVAFDGTFPSGCTEIFTKYTHGWSSNDFKSTSISVGFPPSFGVTVTYGVTAHSWQTVSPQPATYGC